MRRLTLAIAASVAVLVIASGAFALGSPMGSANKTAINQAIASNDYAAWKDAIVSTLTQENFNKIVQRYDSMLQMRQLKTSISSAVASGNYTAYKEAVGSLSTYAMSQDKFDSLTARYNSTGDTPMMGIGNIHRMMRWR
jgi:hypothetical protein